jgi:hypothetical protein
MVGGNHRRGADVWAGGPLADVAPGLPGVDLGLDGVEAGDSRGALKMLSQRVTPTGEQSCPGAQPWGWRGPRTIASRDIKGESGTLPGARGVAWPEVAPSRPVEGP